MSKSPLEIIKSKLSNPNVSSETEDIICELYKLGWIRNEDFYMELNALCNRIDGAIMENSKKNAGKPACFEHVVLGRLNDLFGKVSSARYVAMNLYKKDE